MTEIGDGLEVTTVLFGSSAKGQSDKESDVDLFVIRGEETRSVIEQCYWRGWEVLRGSPCIAYR